MSPTAKALWGLLCLLFVAVVSVLATGILARLWWEGVTFGWGLLG